MKGLWRHGIGITLLFAILGSSTAADVNECLLGTHNCDRVNGRCVNIPGSFICSCNVGYRGNGVTCSDINECEQNTHDCDTLRTCLNTNGSFQCPCSTGYYENGGNCSDINECLAGTHKCDPVGANCNNYPSSYMCACKVGYRGDGFNCTDLDECAEDKDNCHALATCTNTQGSFQCTCNSGYTGNGESCTDVNECQTGAHNCDPDNANCANYPGSYYCSCNVGYRGNGFKCTDVDECTEDKDNCHAQATCTNTQGSFQCACNAGYMGNGENCTDINECEDNRNNCSELASCTNTDGAFRCSCHTGYEGDGVTCSDVNECQRGTHNCDPDNGQCNNYPGSYFCSCNRGYAGNGIDCKDVNECQQGTHNCDSDNGQCNNYPGSYFCSCKRGFQGNGTVCKEICDPPCSANSHCQQDKVCACDEGYQINNRTKQCTAKCAAVARYGFKFPSVFVEQTTFSEEQCDGIGRPQASITCKASTTSGVAADFDRDTLVYVDCTVTIADVTEQRIVATESSIENRTSRVLLLVEGKKLDTLETRSVSNFIHSLSDLVEQENTNLTLPILTNVVRTLSHVSQAIINQDGESDHEQPNIVESLQSIASHLVVVNGSNLTSVESENVAVVIGLPVEAAGRYEDVLYRLNITSNNSNGYSQPAQVFVPAEVYDIANRTSGGAQSFISLFRGRSQNGSGANWVVSADIGRKTNISNLRRPIRITFADTSVKDETYDVPGKLEFERSTLTCVYTEPESGKHSTQGLCLINGTKTCESTHLTSFAILVSRQRVPYDASLSIVSIVGCVLSLLGLCATVVVHLSARKLCDLPQTKVFLHLCVVLALSYALFVGGVWQAKYRNLCTGIAILLHYTLLSAWFWMAIYTYSVYSLLANVFGRPIQHFVPKSCVVGYLLPLFVVVLSLGLSSMAEVDSVEDSEGESLRVCNQTVKEKEETIHFMHTTYRSHHACWITGPAQMYGFIVPCACLLLYNCCLFVLLMKKICKRRVASKRPGKGLKRDVTVAVTMLTVMGFSWVFGYLSLVSTDVAYNKIMSWLFALFSSIQGVLVFLLTAVRRTELRNVWYLPLQSSIFKPLGRLGSRVITRVQSRTGSYLIPDNTSDVTTPSTPATSNLPGYSSPPPSDTGADTSAAYTVQVCLKGKSEGFGTIRVKRHNHEQGSFLYPISEEKEVKK